MVRSAKLVQAGHDLIRHESRAQLTRGFEQFRLAGSSEDSLLCMLWKDIRDSTFQHTQMIDKT